MRHALLLCAVVATAGAAALHAGAAEATATDTAIRPLDRRHRHRFGQRGDIFPESKHSTGDRHRNRVVPSSALAAPPSWRRSLKETTTPGESTTGSPSPSPTREETVLTTNATHSGNGSLTDGRWVWMDYNVTTKKTTLDERVALTGDDCPEGRVRITNSLCVQPE